MFGRVLKGFEGFWVLRVIFAFNNRQDVWRQSLIPICLEFHCWPSRYLPARTRCEIYWKSTIKTPERRPWRRSGVFIVNFELTSHLVLVFLLLTLNMLMPTGEGSGLCLSHGLQGNDTALPLNLWVVKATLQLLLHRFSTFLFHKTAVVLYMNKDLKVFKLS